MLEPAAAPAPSLTAKLRAEAASAWATLGGEPAVVLLGAGLLLALRDTYGSTGFFRAELARLFPPHPAQAAFPYFWWFGASLVLYLVVPLLLAWVTRGGFHRRYGLGLGDWRFGLCGLGVLLAVMLPAVYWASGTRAFAQHYPLAGNGAFQLSGGPTGAGTVSLGLFALYEAAYFAYFVGWEFLLRGFMLNGLLPRFGAAGAVLVPTLPFVMAHFGKPPLETFGSLLAGVALGLLAWRSQSFWYGALAHGLVAVWMDVLAASPYLGRP